MHPQNNTMLLLLLMYRHGGRNETASEYPSIHDP